MKVRSAMHLYRQNIFHFVNMTVILAGLAMMAVLSWQLAGSVNDLRSTPIDNVQWNLSQLEVEHLKLSDASRAVLEDGAAALPEFRKRYDVFYSRVFLINDSAAAKQVHEIPELHHLHETLKTFMSETVDLVDGPDAALVAQMPDMMDGIEDLSPAVRGLSIGGVEISSELSDTKRIEVSRLLFLIAIAAPVTFFALFIALAWQQSQKRELNRRSAEVISANRRYNSTLRASLDAIVVVNEDGRITDFNGSAEAIFGHGRDEVIGREFTDTLFPRHLRDGTKTNFAHFLSSAASCNVVSGRHELEALHRDGHIFPIEISMSETTGENGPNFVAYIRDITQQKNDETELEKARDDALAAFQEKSRFFAMMSHEMRTPLNGIMSSLDLLKDGDLDKGQSRYIDIAETSSRILLSHVNDVLTIEQLDAGDRDVTPEPFAVGEVVASLIDTLQPLADEQNTSLVVVTTGEPGPVVGDLRGIQQILTNLISNAIKFTSSGTVTVSSETTPIGDDDVAIRFSVKDTGVGISDFNQKRIFEDFVTAESPYERRTTGTGLGLGIVRRLVRSMGGELVCESAVDEGSTFWFEVRMSRATGDQPETTPRVTVTGEEPREALSILVVEDNAINRELLEAMIRREGHSAESATNGFEGVHKASDKPFDLILMDISMPNMNGITATQTIRASKSLNAHSPIYAVTAHAMPEEIAEFHRAGMDGCLIKPIQPAKLRDLLRSVADAKLSANAAPEPDAEATQDDEVAKDDAVYLDHAQIRDLVSVLGEQKAQRLFSAFCSEGKTELGNILASAKKGDLDRLQHQAHKLAGSSGTFGAVLLKDTLHGIETACKQGNSATALDLAEKLDGIWRATCKSLSRKRA